MCILLMNRLHTKQEHFVQIVYQQSLGGCVYAYKRKVTRMSMESRKQLRRNHHLGADISSMFSAASRNHQLCQMFCNARRLCNIQTRPTSNWGSLAVHCHCLIHVNHLPRQDNDCNDVWAAHVHPTI